MAEDEDSLAQTLILNLNLAGIDVERASDGKKAIELFKEHSDTLSLALLDVMMPFKDGFEVYNTIRGIQPGFPVIFLTARNQAEDKIRGLKLGAEDYITKPFDLEELMLRIQNILKRVNPARHSPTFHFDNCAIDFETFEVIDVAGHRIPLSKREIGFLKLLTAQPNVVISRDRIIDHLWSDEENASSRTIDNYILSFRKLFEKDPKNPQHFISVRGVGYKFVA